MNPNQFFVLWPDGQKFGPADLPTLQRWIVENRVGPGTLLEEAMTGRHVRAIDVAELRPYLPAVAGMPPGQTFIASNPSSGTTEVTIAWVLGFLALFCIGIPAGLGGLILGAYAYSKRQKGAVGAMVLNIIALGLHIVGFGLLSFFN